MPSAPGQSVPRSMRLASPSVVSSITRTIMLRRLPYPSVRVRSAGRAPAPSSFLADLAEGPSVAGSAGDRCGIPSDDAAAHRSADVRSYRACGVGRVVQRDHMASLIPLRISQVLTGHAVTKAMMSPRVQPAPQWLTPVAVVAQPTRRSGRTSNSFRTAPGRHTRPAELPCLPCLPGVGGGSPGAVLTRSLYSRGLLIGCRVQTLHGASGRGVSQTPRPRTAVAVISRPGR